MADVEIASLFARIGADLTGLEQGLTSAAGMLEGSGRRMAQLGNQLSLGVTLPLALMGRAAVNSAMVLDEQMRNIQSIGKQTDDEIGALSQTFVDLSTDITKTTDTAERLARGFYDVQSSGFYGADAMEVLLRSTKAATAGLSSTQTAAKAITATLNAYGKTAAEAAHISDIMFRTVDKGVVTFEELAGSLSNTLSSAANAGIEFEVVGAAISTLTKQGLSAAEATVSLNQVILSLIDPSDALTDAFHGLGFESGSAALSALGLQGTLTLLRDAGYDTTDEMAKLFGNVRALRGVLGLTGKGAQLFAADLTTMYTAAGATEQAFEIQTQSVAAGFKNLKNEATSLGIDLAQIALPVLQNGVTVLGDLIEQFKGLDGKTKENILAWGLIAAAAGPALKLLGTGAIVISNLIKGFVALNGVLLAAPVFLADVAAGLQLIAGGSGVFAVAGTGAAGLVAALLPVVAVIASVTGALVMMKKTAERVEQGAAGVGDAWGSFFEEQISKGRTAAQIVEEYRAAQDRVRASLESGGLVADLFIRNQDALINATGQLNGALVDAAKTYDEYRAAAEEAGLAAEIFSEAQFTSQKGMEEAAKANIDLNQKLAETSDSYDAYAQAAKEAGLLLMLFSGEEYDAARAARQMTPAIEKLTEETEKFIEPIMTANDMLQVVQGSLNDAGLSGTLLNDVLTQMELTLGTTTQAQADMQTTIQQLSDAYAYGVISLAQFQMYMGKVKDGTINTGPAFDMAIVRNTDLAKAAASAAEAYQNLTIKQLNLAEALKGASKAEIARTAIQELTAAYDAGTLSFPNYVLAVGGVQETFGLVDEKSRAMAEGLTGVVTALTNGVIPAGDFDKALKDIITDAGDGQLNLQTIIDKYALLPANIDPATTSLSNFDEEMSLLPEAATTTVSQVVGAFEGENWSGLGSDIGSGIASGISASTPAIELAARAAARAALEAAQAELGIESPSREFMRVGEMAMSGLVAGMQGMAGYASQATRSVVGDVIGGAERGATGTGLMTATPGDMNITQIFNDAGAAALGMAQVSSMRRARLGGALGR